MTPKTPRCLVCQSPGLRLFVDELLNKGLSNMGIGSALFAAGGKLDTDVIARHKSNHWVAPVVAGAPTATKRDLSILVRDKVFTAVEGKDPELLLLMGKELAPMIGKGLMAQGQLDKRDAAKTKLTGAAEIVGMLSALLHGPAPQLADGLTINGEYEVLDVGEPFDGAELGGATE